MQGHSHIPIESNVSAYKIMIFSEKHKTGIEELDREHEALFFSLKGVLLASLCRTQDSSPKNLEGQLKLLLKTVTNHFRNEERIIEEMNLPDREEHKREHQRLEKEFEEELGKMLMIKEHHELAEKLQHWLESHILEWDKKIKTDDTAHTKN